MNYEGRVPDSSGVHNPGGADDADTSRNDPKTGAAGNDLSDVRQESGSKDTSPIVPPASSCRCLVTAKGEACDAGLLRQGEAVDRPGDG